jgi:DNA-binding transcriptional MerR regulator
MALAEFGRFSAASMLSRRAGQGGLTLKLGAMFTLGAVKGLRVSELAERAGVTASTVRFYERRGLLSPARRARNGYRLFDESALDELAFVQRAKGIGMNLEDIADLVAAWPTGKCRSLQARLRAYLAKRIGEIHQQQAGLGAFERQLQAVLGRLSAHDPGPEQCGRGCYCEADFDLSPRQAAPGVRPEGCSLDGGALAARIGQWREMAAAATSVEHADDTVRLVLPPGPDLVTTAAALCAAETACCSQTRFLLEVTASQLILTVEARGTPGLVEILLPVRAPAGQ